MKLEQFTIKSQEALQQAQELAMQNGHSQIENIQCLGAFAQIATNTGYIPVAKCK